MAAPIALQCPHCPVSCAGAQGLSSHIRAMHPAHAPRAPIAEPRPQTVATGLHRPNVDMRWEDPAPAGRAGQLQQRFGAMVAELKRNPGRWARLADFAATSGATTSRKRLELLYPDVEFVTRKLADGAALFGRARPD